MISRHVQARNTSTFAHTHHTSSGASQWFHENLPRSGDLPQSKLNVVEKSVMGRGIWGLGLNMWVGESLLGGRENGRLLHLGCCTGACVQIPASAACMYVQVKPDRR